MNGQVVLRLLDTFFRHVWLYLLPIVLFGAVGVWSATSAEDSYQSFGTMKVESNSLVGELTGVQQDPGFGWQTPAGATAESFNALMRTQTFLDVVTENAGLEEAVETGMITQAEIRGSIAVYADSTRLVKIQASNRNPDVAHGLAEGAMESYIQAVIDNEVSDSRVAIDFIQQKLPDYEAAVSNAEKAFERWLDENPAPPDGNRPEDQGVQLQRLQEGIATREEQLAEARLSIEQAELALEQKSAEVEQRLQVIDPPQTPTAPLPKTKKAVMTVAMALIVGTIVALIGVVLGTILDRTIRFPGDVKDRLGIRMLAVVPQTRLSAATRKRLEEVEVVAPAVVPVPSTAEDESESDPDEDSVVPTGADVSLLARQPGTTDVTRAASNGARPSTTLTRVP